MKKRFPTGTKLVLALSAALGTVLFVYGYNAAADAGRPDTQPARDSNAGPPPDRASASEADRDPEYVERRREYLRRFLGTGPDGVSPSDYARALEMARALPPSVVPRGRSFMSPEAIDTFSPWTSPIPPPILNNFGGNASGMIYTLGIDPTNANIVYAGGYGGLAKSTNGGVNWQYLSDAWASHAVTSIAIHPSAHNVLYVGTGSDYLPYGAGLYRSTDAGTTWGSPLGASQFAGTAIRTVAIDPNAPSRSGTIIYVANGLSTTSGLWRSNDSGVNWTRLRQAPTLYNGIYDVAVDASTNPSIVYITEEDGTFRSTDSGQNWTFIHSALAGQNKLRVVSSALYLIAPGDPAHNLYKLDAWGEWSQIPTACPSGADACGAGSYLGLGTVAVNPANPQIILGGTFGSFRTTDEGAHWTQIGAHWYGDPDPSLNIHPDHRVIAFSADPAIAYDGNDGGIVRSTDTGAHWTNLNQNLPGALFYSAALSRDGTMIAGSQDNGAVFSRLGAAWNTALLGDSNHNLIDALDGTTAYYVGYSSNGFARFNTVTQASYNIAPAALISDPACNFFPTFSMNTSSSTRLLAACQHVVRTTDGKATPVVWTTIGGSLALPSPAPQNEWWNSVTAAAEAPNNSNVIYAVGQFGKVWVTSTANNGPSATWNDVTQNLPGGISGVTVHPTDSQTAYLACNAAVFKTTNMGGSWTAYGIANLVYRDVAIDPANPQHIFAACNAGVYASTDGGGTWGTIAGIPLGMVVGSLSFNATSRQLAAATYGRGVYLLNLDNVPPTVAITSPADGATVSGNVTVTATADDNHAVAGVQFKLDGLNLQPEDTTAPYSIVWDANLLSGSHDLTAVARDPATNSTTSATVTVKVIQDH